MYPSWRKALLSTCVCLDVFCMLVEPICVNYRDMTSVCCSPWHAVNHWDWSQRSAQTENKRSGFGTLPKLDSCHKFPCSYCTCICHKFLSYQGILYPAILNKIDGSKVKSAECVEWTLNGMSLEIVCLSNLNVSSIWHRVQLSRQPAYELRSDRPSQAGDRRVSNSYFWQGSRVWQHRMLQLLGLWKIWRHSSATLYQHHYTHKGANGLSCTLSTPSPNNASNWPRRCRLIVITNTDSFLGWSFHTTRHHRNYCEIPS